VKRLFMIKTPTGKIALNANDEPIYFDNKVQAKIIRDRMGEGFTVSYGPDHKKHLSNRNTSNNDGSTGVKNNASQAS